jgi:hypothetical protein
MNASSQPLVITTYSLRFEVFTGGIWIVSCGLWHCVDFQVFTIVLEKPAASIFRKEKPEGNNPLVPLFNLKMLTVWVHGSLPHPPQSLTLSCHLINSEKILTQATLHKGPHFQLILNERSWLGWSTLANGQTDWSFLYCFLSCSVQLAAKNMLGY